MAKRKKSLKEPMSGSESGGSDSEESSSDEDTNMLDVDFEWFDPQEQDYDGIKALLRQLFDADTQAHEIDLSAITDLILAQPLLGSTVKVEVDETEKNLFAFLSVLNMQQHVHKPAVSLLKQYLFDRATSCADEKAKAGIAGVLQDSKATIGLILTERMINAPSEIVPPMYKMLIEEMEWALEDNEAYDFTHYLILSKIYHELPSELDGEVDDERQHKKLKKSKRESAPPKTFFFHPEDEIMHRYATAFGNFKYSKETAAGQSDSKRAFQDVGIKPGGHMILIEASNFQSAVKAMQENFGQG